MTCVEQMPESFTVKNTFFHVNETPQTMSLSRSKTCPTTTEEPAYSRVSLPSLACSDVDRSPNPDEQMTPKLPGLMARTVSNFMDDCTPSSDRTPDASPAAEERRTIFTRQLEPTSSPYHHVSTPDSTPLAAFVPTDHMAMCRQLLANFTNHQQQQQPQQHMQQPMQQQVVPQPAQMPVAQPMQPVQAAPMQVNQTMQQPVQTTQNGQSMPIMNLGMIPMIQLNPNMSNGQGYPTFPQQQVTFYQPTFPSAAPDRTPPQPLTPAEQEFAEQRRKWKEQWAAEEQKEQFADWADEDFLNKRRPRRRRQRRVEPVPPEMGGKVFVGGLGPQTTSHALREYFTQFGRVLDAAVLADSETKRSRGFGFVDFAGEIPAAVLETEHVIEQRRCGVRPYSYSPEN
jgi:hypothetical protein